MPAVSPAARQETFVQPPGGRFAVGCLALHLGIPTFASVLVLWSNFGPAIAAIPLVVWLVVAKRLLGDGLEKQADY